MAIEIERRGLVDENHYKNLPKEILTLGGTDLGENDTRTIFYITANAQVKVQLASNKGGAKIAWKSGGIDYSVAREEIEVKFLEEDFDDAVLLLNRLMPNAKQFTTEQKRHDFKLENVDIALKFSNDWGYHIEFEMLANDKKYLSSVLEIIEKLAGRLGECGIALTIARIDPAVLLEDS